MDEPVGAARCRIRVTGTVQGVGFRPFVYREAAALGLHGFVRNDSLGVLAEAEGERTRVVELIRVIAERPPPLARVASVEPAWLEVLGLDDGFRIEASVHEGDPAAAVSIDSATCAACLAEVDAPTDRRYRYPFINCTNCGPRYTIVRAVPYDRPLTTMAGFTMCPACQAEYDDPGDHRFHAQPNACPVCGPQLAWRDPSGELLAERDEALLAAAEAIRQGLIVAVKGVGGFHLAVDATNAVAVAELRRRKQRDDKPFAVMPPDLATAAELCLLDDVAVDALTSPRRPIVLAPHREAAALAPGVAPGLRELGLLLPYSALHHLLLREVCRPVVLTSGNVSDEPIAHTDADAQERLGPLVDGVLTHNRAIHIRCDDSVARAAGGELHVLRRSRGYAPEALALPFAPGASVLAVGAELKSTVAVTKGAAIVASHHLGDLEHLATYRSFLQAVDHLPALYGVRPEVVAHDLHPEYLSTKFALDTGLATVAVQHHHAHIAACLVEHGRTGPVLGLAFDGLGYGADGTLWGGEMLVADLAGFERVAHLRSVPMPGGAAAIRQPWRMAAVWAAAAVGTDAAVRALPDVDEAKVAAVLDLAATTGALQPRSVTSVGRLFDAVAVLLGCRAEVSYEAQAAIELEALAGSCRAGPVLNLDAPLSVTPARCGSETSDPGEAPAPVIDPAPAVVIDPAPLVAALLAERDAGADCGALAAGFHDALARGLAEVAVGLAANRGLATVALGGGVFQNARFTTTVVETLREANIEVLVPTLLPPNDGAISLGQGAIAAWATR